MTAWIRSRTVLGVVVSLALLPATGAWAADWSRFRGPNGSGISGDPQPLPTVWSSTERVRWKVRLPGPGVSSPIVAGPRVWVTCYSGYGLDRQQPGNIEDLRRHLICFDKVTGQLLWNKSVAAVLPEDPFAGIGVTAHGYASHTPVSDGQRVFTFFGKTGVLAYDLDGNQLWQTSVGTESDPWAWGSAASPILYQDTVLVTAAAEGQALVALDQRTGTVVWRQEAAGLDGTWSTPILVPVDSQRTDLVLCVPGEIWGLNPATGELRWLCTTAPSEQAHSSGVTDAAVVYVSTEHGGRTVAVRAGGRRDVTGSHLLWSGRETVRFGSPVLYEGRLYLVADHFLRVVDVRTGDRRQLVRLTTPTTPGRRQRENRGFGSSLDYASPVIGDGKLFYLNGDGETFVFAVADQEVRQLAVNRLTDEPEFFGGTPAISEGRLYIRSDRHLYCVADD